MIVSIAYYSLSTTTQTHSNLDNDAKYCLVFLPSLRRHNTVQTKIMILITNYCLVFTVYNTTKPFKTR